MSCSDQRSSNWAVLGSIRNRVAWWVWRALRTSTRASSMNWVAAVPASAAMQSNVPLNTAQAAHGKVVAALSVRVLADVNRP